MVMEGGDGQVELGDEELVVEEVDTEMQEAFPEAVAPEFLDEQTRMLAAGLASQDEGELLAALEEMQKAVIGSRGEKVLVAYVLASPQCAELMGAWEAGPGSATAVPVLLLLYYMFRHPLGKFGGTASGDTQAALSLEDAESHRRVVAVKLRLDKLARSIVRTRMKDIYSHLSSSQKSRQNSALLLLSAIVLRGRALAIEIATSFDFTLEALRKLGHPPKQGAGKVVRVEGHRGILKQPTRVAFVELAMSFLSVGDPGLLRWILQKRPLWIGVLHGISKDDERTIVRVLTLLQKKVMAAAFMVPRGLQSVLFGDATLDQLARISSDTSLVDAGEVAHTTLLSLCTDPSHGLCPENSELWEATASSRSGAFGGGQARLLRLMLRLKVTEVDRHRDLLLATARTRPKLAALYLASIPLSLEPRVSPAWFNAMSLVSQLIAIASKLPPSFPSLAAQSLLTPTLDGHLIQSMLLSLLPASLSRVVLNRGLLHVDFMVRHACLRVLLETLLCLRRLIDAVDAAGSSELAQRSAEVRSSAKNHDQRTVTSLEPGVEKDWLRQDWIKLSQSIQDIMRASLPDPNTLLAMLSNLKASQSSSANATTTTSSKAQSEVTKKRKRDHQKTEIGTHEQKNSASEKYDYDAMIRLLWGPEILDEAGQREETEALLHAKVVEVLAAYQMALPIAMADTGFDAFKLLPDDPTSLSVAQQKSLAALLLAATGSTTLSLEESRWSFGGLAGFGSAYKKFKQLLMFILNSEVKEVRDALYLVAHRVMASTGAFDSNPREIALWLDLLVRWRIEKSGNSHTLEGGMNLVRKHALLPGTLHASLVDFLSEAVSRIGKNIYKYLDSLHSILAKHRLHEGPESSVLQGHLLQGVNTPEFGPFVVCTLESCIQSILSKSKVPAERFTVALYVSNVLELLLKYQVKPQSLAAVVVTLLSVAREPLAQEQVESPDWTVLLVLFQHAQSLVSSNGNNSFRGLSTSTAATLDEGYRAGRLAEVLKACREDQEATLEAKLAVLTSSLDCISGQDLVDNFPLLMTFCLEDLEGDFSVPIGLLGIYQEGLCEVSVAWPEMFTGAVELAVTVKDSVEYRWTVGEVKALTVKLGSSSEISGFCALLLIAPFSVLFSAAAYCKQGLLLTSPTFSNLLQAGLWRVSYQNWVCMVRLIVSGMKHLAPLSGEGIDVGCTLETCFSLIRSLVLPTQQSLGGSFLSEDSIRSSEIMSVYEDMVLDLLNHPEVYNLFMHSDRRLDPCKVPCSFASDMTRDSNNKKTCDPSLRRVLASAATNIRPIDCHILSLLRELLDPSKLAVKSAPSLSEAEHASGFRRKVVNACNAYILKATCIFQKEVDDTSKRGVVASPALFAVSVLISYADPSLLLSIFLSLLSQPALKVKSSKQAVAPHVVGLHFVTVFVDSWSGAAPNFTDLEDQSQAQACDGTPQTHVDVRAIYDLYEKVIDQVTGNPSIIADLCLLSFLQASNLKQLHFDGSENLLNRFSTTSSDLAHSSPLDVLRHCVCHPNRVTGKIALLLVKTSPVHLTELGRLLVQGTANRRLVNLDSSSSLKFASMLLTQHVRNQKTELVLSDQDLLLLLPAAHVYLASESRKADLNENELANHIASVYAKLLSKQLKAWENFVSAEIAIDGVQDMSFPIGTCQPDHSLHLSLLKYYNCSPLGEVVDMLQSCHTLHPLSLRMRTRLFQSLLPEDHAPLATQNMLLSAGEDLSHCVFEAVAKADIIKHLLNAGFRSQAKGDGPALETEGQDIIGQQADESTSQEDNAALKFLTSLMSTLDMLYKSKALNLIKMDMSLSKTQTEAGKAHWVQFFEDCLLVQITDVAKELALSPLDLSKYLPLYRSSMTTLLGYRYGEISAMKAARHLTYVLFEGLQLEVVSNSKSADADVLELLIAHSKFLPTLLVMDSKRMHIPHISGKHAGKGTALNSLSSILSLVGSPLVHTLKSGSNQDTAVKLKSRLKETISSGVKEGTKISVESVKQSEVNGPLDDLKRLELVKLLRILLGVRLKQVTLGAFGAKSLPPAEVLSILLAAYGGTMSSVDQEIFLTMQEIESQGGPGFSGLSGLDYLWGEAALKRRRAKAEDVMLNVLEEPDSNDELRRQTFKEDLLIDPRRCGLTVLFFPLKRQFGGADIGQSELALQYKNGNEKQPQGARDRDSAANEGDMKAAAYDPAFLMSFARHGLSVGCINGEEFVRLGLLAVAFASTSSAEESMRKAGYEILAQYYSVLEEGPSFKGRLQIRLLMTYVKNAVTEPWQRIPAVFAVFAAEASCILMHPENHQYMIINRFLLRAPFLDLESIPLFQVMFGSGSVQYRSDRLWMLRLLAAGLRSSLDARVYRRKFILELLMSFHDSAMADTFPRKWVLQVLYQAATVRSCARYLVECTGLLSWLSSVAVSDVEGNLGLQEDGSSGQIASMALQVIDQILSWGSVQRHFLVDCLEELSKAGHIFHQLLVRNSTPKYQNMFRRSTLTIMLTLVRLSHKRRKHLTHFSLNLGGLLDVLRWVGSAVPESHMEDKALALQLFLHTSPPSVYSNQEKVSLLKVASWAVSVALQLENGSADGSGGSFVVNSHPSKVQEGLSEKLLRWLAASIVLGGVDKGAQNMDSGGKFDSCFSVVGCFKSNELTEGKSSSSEVNEKLASLLLTLEGYVSGKAECASLLPLVAALVALTQFTRTTLHPGDLELHVTHQKIGCILELLLKELPCPVETNSSWQWSFNSPWTVHDDSVQSTDDSAVQARYVSEICQTLLVFIQQLLSRRSTHYSSLLSRWEALLGQKPQTDHNSELDLIRKMVDIKFSTLQAKLCNALLRIPASCQEEQLQNKV